jgi:hypothetical protein
LREIKEDYYIYLEGTEFLDRLIKWRWLQGYEGRKKGKFFKNSKTLTRLKEVVLFYTTQRHVYHVN